MKKSSEFIGAFIGTFIGTAIAFAVIGLFMSERSVNVDKGNHASYPAVAEVGKVTDRKVIKIAADAKATALVKQEVLTKDLNATSVVMANRGEMRIPVNDVTVRGCQNRLDKLKCDVGYDYAGFDVTAILILGRNSATSIQGPLPLPMVRDLRMADCHKSAEGHLKCAIRWHFSTDTGVYLETADGFVDDEDVKGSIVFVGFHQDEGTYEGRLQLQGSSRTTTVFVLREVVERDAPGLVGSVPDVGRNP